MAPILTVLALLSGCAPTPYPIASHENDDPDVASEPDPGTSEPLLHDDAAIVDAAFPDSLACDEAETATVTVRNTGTTTWTPAHGFRLGAVGDADELHPGDARVLLDEGETVLPGATRTFAIDLMAGEEGTYTSDWQMVHEGVRWFGGTATHEVVATCPADEIPAFDPATAVILNSPPDALTWPETAAITTLDLQADGVYIDFTRRDGDDSWPDVPFGAPGDSLEYTLWIAMFIDGQWYTSGCIQYWRGLDRNGGPPSGYAENWYYDTIRWGPMVGHQPAVGETVGFFVTAGDARNVTDGSGSIVYERSNIVWVPFPSDDGAIFNY